MSDLPLGWMYACLPELISSDGIFVDGDWVETKDQDPTGDVRLIQLADIGDGRYVDKSNRFLTQATAIELGCTFLKRGDVLVARMPDPLGRACLFPGDSKQAVTVVDVCIIRGKEEHFNRKWLMYFINSPSFRTDIHSLQSGSTRKRISRGNLSTLRLPVPPRAEQTRIVEKLEELFTEFDIGVAELKTAQKKLIQYRQSLLKAAVEGALTADWRENNHSAESGAQLLERILVERRTRWEAKQLAKFAEQNKKQPKDWQKKYPLPVQPDTAGLPQLPEGWVWASLDMLGDIASGVAKGIKRKDGIALREVPYLRVANVQRGYLDLSEVKTIFATQRDIEELTLVNGDVLFNEGGDRDKLGRGCVWRDEIADCIHQNHVFRVRPYITDLQSEFLSHHGNTFGKFWFRKAGKQTTNLASINMTMLRLFPVPIPPPAEQRVIVQEIQSQLEVVASQEQAIELAIKQSVAQRQNILRSAFNGQLVPQDPNDEPASVLLERIRINRIEQAKSSKPRKSKKKESSPVVRKLVDVLSESGDWLSAQEAFRRCGVADGAQTEEIEALYAELRALDKNQRLLVEAITESVETTNGKEQRKIADRLKLVG